jgi:hypothetical protein
MLSIMKLFNMLSIIKLSVIYWLSLLLLDLQADTCKMISQKIQKKLFISKRCASICIFLFCYLKLCMGEKYFITKITLGISWLPSLLGSRKLLLGITPKS